MELLIIRGAGRGFEGGEIIDARPDGFAWGAQELANPVFRIVRVPDAALAGIDRNELLASVVDPNAPDGSDPVAFSNSHRIVGANLLRRFIDNSGRPQEQTRVPNIPHADLPSEVNRRLR